MAERPTRTEGEPHDRLTRLVDAAMRAIEGQEEYDGERLIVFLDGDERAALGTSGYEADTEAMANLFLHLRALMRANGKDMALVPLGKG